MKRILSVMLALSLAITLCACSKKPAEEKVDVQDKAQKEPATVDFSNTDSDMFTSRDEDITYDSEGAVTITLSGNTASASSDSVKISGSKITVTEQATYIVSGELTDGMLIVDAPDTAKLQIILNGASITSKTSAALYVLNADKVFITLHDGTQNALANGGSFTAIDSNNIDSALFSKQDLTLNGNGALTVTSPAGHGIVCKDDLVMTGGSYTVSSASHGLDANDSIRIKGVALNIDAGKDAIHAENTDDATLGFVYISGGNIKAEAEGDGIDAGAYMQITDGNIDLLAGGGSVNASKQSSDYFGGFMGGKMPPQGFTQGSEAETQSESSTSMKGLKSANSMQISGGNIVINSADDSIHSDASVDICGGTFTLRSGDDAIHAEDALSVSGGSIDISESYEGLEALHIDIKSGDIKLIASDDGLNAAGGTDQSGFTGGRDGMFGGEKQNTGGKQPPDSMGGTRPDGMDGTRPDGMDGTRPDGMGGGGMSANSNGSIKISGGSIYINASGDGLDANGSLEISDGQVTVVGPTRGDTATLDYDSSGVINGGTFIGTGASGMAQTFSDSAQGVISLSTGNQSAGTQIVLKDENGKVLLSHNPELDFAVVILSSPDIVKGKTYTVLVGQNENTAKAK